MKIVATGKIDGRDRVLVWEDGQISGDEAATSAFDVWSQVYRGATVRFPEAGSVRCDPTTPWGFWAIAVGTFDEVPDRAGDDLPVIADDIPEDAVP